MSMAAGGHAVARVGWRSALSVLLLALALCSCGTQLRIAYFQDVGPGESGLAAASPVEIRLRPKDEVSILVTSQDPRLTNLFNLPIVSTQVGVENSTGTNRGLSGYTVDSDGDIDFPVVGRVHVGGMTREEVSSAIKEELTSRSLVRDPVVTVRFMNLTVSVLGEVNKPGRYSIDKDRVTLLDALGMAGDLTIYGRRDCVRVLRVESGGQRAYSVDLRKAGRLYSSPVYWLQQGDVVYVEPNATRARQSTVNGNTVRSTSFWLSLASLAATVAVLIVQ